MRILLDTHVIIWALTNDPRLSDRARKLIASSENRICFSAVSIWEIAIKNQKSPEKCPYNEKEILSLCMAAGYEPMDIQPAHVLAIRELQLREGRVLSNLDPFDRLLIAQAKVEGCTLLSHDRNFENYREKCISLF